MNDNKYKCCILLILLLIDVQFEVKSRYISALSERSKRALFEKTVIKWPNGIIPYKNEFGGDYNDMIQKSMAAWNDETCINFRPYNSNDKNWIRIMDHDGCESEYAGMGRQGEQYVYLNNPGCFWFGLIAHELGHVIGLMHEQRRFDRDKHIRINHSVILPYYLTEFEKIDESNSETVGTPYDLQSVMQYGPNSFVKVYGQQSVSTKNKNIEKALTDPTIKDLSFWDVKAVNEFYGCSNHCKNEKNCEGKSYLDKNCQCQTVKSFMKRRCVNVLSDSECVKEADEDRCLTDSSWMSFRCRKACNMCFNNDLKKAGKTQAFKCKDYHDKCSEWASMGECSVNPAYMHVYCPLSCQLCNSDKKNCEDRYYDKESCKKWAESGECDINPLVMKVECAASCKQC